MIEPYREQRPWGDFVRFTHNAPSTVKIITVLPNQSLSLQYHKKREEFWHAISGTAQVTIDQTIRTLQPGDEILVAKGTHHRITAGAEPFVFLEIATGIFDENDIVRLKDDYGRAQSGTSGGHKPK